MKLKHELDRVRNERDRMLQENSDIGRDKSDADAEKLRFKVCSKLQIEIFIFNTFQIHFISRN